MDCSGRPWLAAFEPGAIASSRSAAFASAAVISMWYSCVVSLSATVTVTVIHVFGAAIWAVYILRIGLYL